MNVFICLLHVLFPYQTLALDDCFSGTEAVVVSVYPVCISCVRSTHWAGRVSTKITQCLNCSGWGSHSALLSTLFFRDGSTRVVTNSWEAVTTFSQWMHMRALLYLKLLSVDICIMPWGSDSCRGFRSGLGQWSLHMHISQSTLGCHWEQPLFALGTLTGSGPQISLALFFSFSHQCLEAMS